MSDMGARIWQQRTNIPKDSENWFHEWYPSAVKARKVVCFISADYLKSPYCMKVSQPLCLCCFAAAILRWPFQAWLRASNPHHSLISRDSSDGLRVLTTVTAGV